MLPLQTGEGRNGIWKKQEFILEVPGQVTRKICFSLWGEKIDQFKPTEGDDTEVSFDLESREYNGRWYTEAKAWKLSRKGSTAGMPPEDAPPADYMPGNGADDLPF